MAPIRMLWPLFYAYLFVTAPLVVRSRLRLTTLFYAWAIFAGRSYCLAISRRWKTSSSFTGSGLQKW